MNQTEMSKKSKLLIFTAGLILSGIYIIAGRFGFEHLWGFNQLQYFGPVAPIIFGLTIIIVLIPAGNKFIFSIVDFIIRSFSGQNIYIRLATLILVSGTLFYLLRVEVHSLGDGYQRIYQIERGYLYYYSEPLDFSLHAILYQILNYVITVTGEFTYVLVSIISGIIAVASIVLFKLPSEYKNHSGFIKLIILTLGGSLLFFGYVESYSLVYLFSLLFILYAVRVYHENNGLLLCSILFFMAAISHMSGLILAPALLFLIYRSGKNGVAGKEILVSLSLGLLPVVFYFSQYIWFSIYDPDIIRGGGDELLPIYLSGEYSIFSPAHLFDILNQFLLIGPAVILIKMLGWPNQPLKHILQNLIFPMHLIIPSLVFIFIVEPKLGFSRDWDLFAAPAMIISIGAIIMISTTINTNRINRTIKTYIGALSILFISFWIILNSVPAKQLERAESLLRIDPKGSGYSTELLARYYTAQINNPKKAIQLLESIQGQARNQRVLSKLVRAYNDIGDLRSSITISDQLLANDSSFMQMNFLSGINRLKLDDPIGALPYLLRSHRIEPNRYNIHYYIASAYFQLDSLPEAAKSFSESITQNPQNITTYFDLANIYLLTGRYSSANQYLQQGLKIKSDYPGVENLRMLIRQGLDSLSRSQ